MSLGWNKCFQVSPFFTRVQLSRIYKSWLGHKCQGKTRDQRTSLHLWSWSQQMWWLLFTGYENSWWLIFFRTTITLDIKWCQCLRRVSVCCRRPEKPAAVVISKICFKLFSFQLFMYFCIISCPLAVSKSLQLFFRDDWRKCLFRVVVRPSGGS